MGVLINNFNLNESDFNKLDLICYPVPLKNSNIQLYPSLKWNIPDHDELIIIFMSGGLTINGDYINWDLGEKMSNTLLFKKYINSFVGSRANFNGHLPITFLFKQ